jgi:hypothetical protein
MITYHVNNVKRYYSIFLSNIFMQRPVTMRYDRSETDRNHFPDVGKMVFK